jgi:hypothetical protein
LALGLNYKYQLSLNKLAMDKHSSLFPLAVKDEEKRLFIDG